MSDRLAVLVSDATGSTPALAAAERWLAGRGFVVSVVELPALLQPGSPMTEIDDALDALDDGQQLARIDAARRALGSPAIIVGTGAGGTLAMLALSALTGFRAAVCFQPRVHYPTLTERKPAQPLDLLPGICGSLQVHFGEDAPARHIAALERRLEGSSQSWQVLRYPGPGDALYDPDGSGGGVAWRRVERFLTQATPGRRA